MAIIHRIAPGAASGLFPSCDMCDYNAFMYSEGYFLALTRDESRRLFGLRADAERWALVAELRGDAAAQREGRVLECGPVWESLHRALGDGSTAPEGGEYPRNHCVLGGRVLTEDESHGRIILKRPDMTQHVAESLAAMSHEEWDGCYTENIVNRPHNGSPTEDDLAAVWNLFQAARDFYRLAAEQKCAVLFVNEKKA